MQGEDFQSIGGWLDFEMWAWHSKVKGDECELAGAGFKWTKWLDKSCICHQREVCRFSQKGQLWHFDEIKTWKK